MSTVQASLDRCYPGELPDLLKKASPGELFAGMIPRLVERTGLASSATQVHSLPGPIFAVTDTAGTTAITMVTGTAGAGEVQVTYDADGLATLVFGSGAVTAYNVLQCVIPTDLADNLAATWTGAL